MQNRLASPLGWLAAAALSAYACRLVVHFPTPIDAALPFLAVIVTVVAWAGRVEGLAAVPLLMLAEIAIVDEHARLVAFGLVMAGAFALALLCHPEPARDLAARATLPRRDPSRAQDDTRATLPRRDPSRAQDDTRATLPRRDPSRAQDDTRATLPRRDPSRAQDDTRAAVLTACAVFVLRWIPLPEVLLWRELLLIALALAIVKVMRASAFAVAIAVLTALVTPAVPLRTFWLPLAVLIAMVVFRFLGMPRLRADFLGAGLVAAMLVFFAWSGVLARALPYLLREPPNVRREPVGAALLRAESVVIDVPAGAKALVVSGANVPMLQEGALIGRIEPGPRAIRIGDLADWGYLRREQFHAARNVLPRDPAGQLRGYGYTAWVDGRGRVPLPEGARQIRVTAAEGLPEGARLQVDFLESDAR